MADRDRADGGAMVRSVTAGDGVSIDYEVAGNGEPVVMLHGFWAGRAAWSRQRVLADRWRLVMPSMRGHDGSDGRLPPGYAIGTTELDDLLRVLDAERLGRFHVVAHSSGGTLAHALVRRHPERVGRMVLIEPTLLNLLHPAERDDIRATFGGFAEAARRHGDRNGVATALAWLASDAWARMDEGKRKARLDAMAPTQHLCAPHFQSLVDFPVTADEIRQVASPTLLVYGADSWPVEAQLAARLREIRPDWPMLTVDGASHNCFREKPEVVNAAIAKHLAG